MQFVQVGCFGRPFFMPVYIKVCPHIKNLHISGRGNIYFTVKFLLVIFYEEETEIILQAGKQRKKQNKGSCKRVLVFAVSDGAYRLGCVSCNVYN